MYRHTFYSVHSVGVGAEVLFYWSVSLPMAEKKVSFFEFINILWKVPSWASPSLQPWAVLNIDFKSRVSIYLLNITLALGDLDFTY